MVTITRKAYVPPLAPSLRMTRQRQMILQELQRGPGHPTADELFARVRRRLPRTSLGTVYRNLDTLADLGVIRKVESGGAQRRFDARVDDHYHVRCAVCGRVEDVAVRPSPGVERALQPVTNYEITGHRLEFVGRCPRCRRQASR